MTRLNGTWFRLYDEGHYNQDQTCMGVHLNPIGGDTNQIQFLTSAIFTEDYKDRLTKTMNMDEFDSDLEYQIDLSRNLEFRWPNDPSVAFQTQER